MGHGALSNGPAPMDTINYTTSAACGVNQNHRQGVTNENCR